ncbi:DUF6286 domain-containing protein [Rhodococcus sp. X156]|uniref:DUF6286 domain-containing protein n=1 Tax=Rhodococcus sp. X156 TaxID=2499145 RepID=UPI000FD88537|nr:DUF6286 domain-containing protein [Rhodococcus sp. X156]
MTAAAAQGGTGAEAAAGADQEERTGRHRSEAASPGLAGRTPVAAPGAASVGIFLAGVVIVIGLVGIREAVLGSDALDGESWVAELGDWVDGLTPQTWMVPVGVVAILVGLWWLYLALKPRRRTELKITSDGGLWMRPRDVSRIAAATADDVAGTTTARATTGRRRVTVTITAARKEADALRESVAEAVSTRLQALDRRPSVKVRTKISHDGGAS